MHPSEEVFANGGGGGEAKLVKSAQTICSFLTGRCSSLRRSGLKARALFRSHVPRCVAYGLGWDFTSEEEEQDFSTILLFSLLHLSKCLSSSSPPQAR